MLTGRAVGGQLGSSGRARWKVLCENCHSVRRVIGKCHQKQRWLCFIWCQPSQPQYENSGYQSIFTATSTGNNITAKRKKKPASLSCLFSPSTDSTTTTMSFWPAMSLSTSTQLEIIIITIINMSALDLNCKSFYIDIFFIFKVATKNKCLLEFRLVFGLVWEREKSDRIERM